MRGTVKTKVYLNKRKLKKILTESVFERMVVKGMLRYWRGDSNEKSEIRNEELSGASPVTTVVDAEGHLREVVKTFEWNERGVYVFEHGFKGDLEITFYGVERLGWLDFWVR